MLRWLWVAAAALGAFLLVGLLVRLRRRKRRGPGSADSGLDEVRREPIITAAEDDEAAPTDPRFSPEHPPAQAAAQDYEPADAEPDLPDDEWIRALAEAADDNAARATDKRVNGGPPIVVAGPAKPVAPSPIAGQRRGAETSPAVPDAASRRPDPSRDWTRDSLEVARDNAARAAEGRRNGGTSPAAVEKGTPVAVPSSGTDPRHAPEVSPPAEAAAADNRRDDRSRERHRNGLDAGRSEQPPAVPAATFAAPAIRPLPAASQSAPSPAPARTIAGEPTIAPAIPPPPVPPTSVQIAAAVAPAPWPVRVSATVQIPARIEPSPYPAAPSEATPAPVAEPAARRNGVAAPAGAGPLRPAPPPAPAAIEPPGIDARRLDEVRRSADAARATLGEIFGEPDEEPEIEIEATPEAPARPAAVPSQTSPEPPLGGASPAPPAVEKAPPGGEAPPEPRPVPPRRFDSSPRKFGGLDARHRVILANLSQREQWSRAEFETLVRKLGLMPDGTLQTINAWSQEKHAENLIEGDDPLIVNRKLASGIL